MVKVRRRETLQQLQEASKDLPAEEESAEEIESEKETASLPCQSLEEVFYSWTQALRDSGESLSLNDDHCQRWVVLVMYHNFLKQSILMPYHTAPQVYVLS